MGSPSVGPSRRFMMSRTTLSIVRPRLRRSVRTRPPATPPTPSAPSGPRRCAPCLRASEEVHSHHWLYQGAQGAVCSCWMWLQTGRGGVLRQDSDRGAGRPQGTVFSGAPENLQARHQAGAQVGAHRGVCGCTQGGVHQVQDQPQEGQETCGQEVVLRSYSGIWSRLILFTLIKLPFIVAEDMNIIVSSQLLPGVLKTLWCHSC